MFETFEHTADVGLRIVAPDLDTLFAEAAQALFSLIVDNPDEIRAARSCRIDLAGSDREYLLFDWLNELLYLCDSQRLVFCRFAVTVTDSGLCATVEGEPLDPLRHHLSHEVKAITYHGLTVERVNEGWRGEVIVDI